MITDLSKMASFEFGTALQNILVFFYEEYIRKLEEYHRKILDEQQDLIGAGNYFQCSGCMLTIYGEDSPFCSCHNYTPVCYRCHRINEFWKQTEDPLALKCERCDDVVWITQWDPLPEKPVCPLIYSPK